MTATKKLYYIGCCDCRLLGENPQYHGKFKFADVAVADFHGNQKVLVQARKTLEAVDQCVGWMDSPEDMKKRMVTLAKTHKSYGVFMKDFDVSIYKKNEWMNGWMKGWMGE